MEPKIWRFDDCEVEYFASDGLFEVTPKTGESPYYYVPYDDGDILTMCMSLDRGESPLAKGGPFPLGLYI